MATAVAGDFVVDAKRDRLVIFASALGTVFEWYDFFVYGTLAVLIAKLFFPAANETAGFLLALATFGAGFGVRPLGAIFFGYLGDRLGRKYTFLVTITLMGVATAAVGMLPTYAQIGIAAPILLVICRLAQGLALGGEYGGAAVYVAEHAPRDKRGFYTSFIQASVIGGFLLSLAVVLVSGAFVDPVQWEAWGWRVPFLFSLVLLAISLWVRLKLKESPVFQAMKEAGEVARNPLRESFDSWPKVKMVLVALFGIAAGLTVIWYTAQFQALYFLQNTLRIDDTTARIVIGIAAAISVFWFLLFGWLSDKVGRRKPIVIGYALTILLMFPLFHWMANIANPGLSAAMERSPVVVTGSDCRYDPFATGGQTTACGRILDILSKKGVAYAKVEAPRAAPAVTIGGTEVQASDPAALDAALKAAGYPLDKIVPPAGRLWQLVLAITVIGFLSGMTFGPVAALLVELFPARTRYTSMSIPYHIGTGYFGGFLPFISQYIVARTGDPFAGLWYTIGVVAMALAVTFFWLPETAGRELD
ncbi:MHS family MFS transporter [Allosphingosinicella flava]|uniref:MHS family MFS transporter n=1 Tax=Allosphingosinicella flava TaxID=2771430 RepID=A0A7T2GKK4_9SPHN|nr:MFS transporter [Sphingosinicella flava]QPQ55233.1 MHS family MFS transporter [Sphingosinicella flava]